MILSRSLQLIDAFLAWLEKQKDYPELRSLRVNLGDQELQAVYPGTVALELFRVQRNKVERGVHVVIQPTRGIGTLKVIFYQDERVAPYDVKPPRAVLQGRLYYEQREGEEYHNSLVRPLPEIIQALGTTLMLWIVHEQLPVVPEGVETTRPGMIYGSLAQSETKETEE